MTFSQFQARYQFLSPLRQEDLAFSQALSVQAIDRILSREVTLHFSNAPDKEMAAALENLSSPYLQRVYAQFELELESAPRKFWVMVLEQAVFDNLNEFLKTYPPEPLLNKLIRQMLEGLAYIHQEGFCLRSLSPESILVTRNSAGEYVAKAALSSLAPGAAQMEPELEQTTGGRYRNHIAPELFQESHATAESNCWAIGALLFEIFTGEHPLTSPKVKEYSSDFLLHLNNIPSPYRQLVEKTLVFEPERRANAKELIHLLVDERPAPLEGPSAPREDSSRTGFIAKNWLGRIFRKN